MLNIPATSKNDMSSICNFGEDSTPNYSPATNSMRPTAELDYNEIFGAEAFAYRDEAIPFITIDEDSSK